MTYEYLKAETDRLTVEKIPVRAIYRDGDVVRVDCSSPPSGDQQRYISTEIFPDDEVVFETVR